MKSSMAYTPPPLLQQQPVSWTINKWSIFPIQVTRDYKYDKEFGYVCTVTLT